MAVNIKYLRRQALGLSLYRRWRRRVKGNLIAVVGAWGGGNASSAAGGGGGAGGCLSFFDGQDTVFGGTEAVTVALRLLEPIALAHRNQRHYDSVRHRHTRMGTRWRWSGSRGQCCRWGRYRLRSRWTRWCRRAAGNNVGSTPTAPTQRAAAGGGGGGGKAAGGSANGAAGAAAGGNLMAAL